MIFLQKQRKSSKSRETKDSSLEEDTQATIADIPVHSPTQVILHIVLQISKNSSIYWVLNTQFTLSDLSLINV